MTSQYGTMILLTKLTMKTLVCLVVLTLALNGSGSVNGKCPPANGTSEEEDVFEYSTARVSHEFIVKFKGFYKSLSRRKFILAAVSQSSQDAVDIVERRNPMAAYPSDFDLVKIATTTSSVPGNDDNLISALLKHPLVKSVTPQLKVTRGLKHSSCDNCSTSNNLDDLGTELLVKGRRSLNFGRTQSAFWQSTGRHTREVSIIKDTDS